MCEIYVECSVCVRHILYVRERGESETDKTIPNQYTPHAVKLQTQDFLLSIRKY